MKIYLLKVTNSNRLEFFKLNYKNIIRIFNEYNENKNFNILLCNNNINHHPLYSDLRRYVLVRENSKIKLKNFLVDIHTNIINLLSTYNLGEILEWDTSLGDTYEGMVNEIQKINGQFYYSFANSSFSKPEKVLRPSKIYYTFEEILFKWQQNHLCASLFSENIFIYYDKKKDRFSYQESGIGFTSNNFLLNAKSVFSSWVTKEISEYNKS